MLNLRMFKTISRWIPKKRNVISAHKRRYLAYLQSREWGVLRRQVIFRDGSCVICDERDEKKFQIHHRHYRNIRNEKLEDLTTLCDICHPEVTKMLERRGWRGR